MGHEEKPGGCLWSASSDTDPGQRWIQRNPLNWINKAGTWSSSCPKLWKVNINVSVSLYLKLHCNQSTLTLCSGKISLLKGMPVAPGKILSQMMNLVLLLLKSKGHSDVNRNARGNRFQSGQHKKSSQILNNPVLDMEIFTLATQQILNIQLPNWEIAWDFGGHPSKKLVHL